jgi:hypothetical protein
MNGGATASETLDLAFGYRSAADDKALTSCKLQKQRK